MSEPSYTPRPWRVGIDGYTIRQDLGIHGGYYIASTAANYPERMPDHINHRDKSNARLIAAAPELLDMLIQLHSNGGFDNISRLGECAELIARATGKSAHP